MLEFTSTLTIRRGAGSLQPRPHIVRILFILQYQIGFYFLTLKKGHY